MEVKGNPGLKMVRTPGLEGLVRNVWHAGSDLWRVEAELVDGEGPPLEERLKED